MIKIANRLELVKLLPAGARLAEIGVRRAAFSNEVLSYCPLEKMYLIDSWMEYRGYHESTQEGHDNNYLETLRVASNHGGRAEVIRAFSSRVAQVWPSIYKPLDAVYIDANHVKGAVIEDLYNWSRCLAPGGVLMGHDYIDSDSPEAKRFDIQVVEAVDHFCIKYGWKITHLTEEHFASYRLEKC